MIKIAFLYSNELICGFEVSGHSQADISGRDIICAAVSSAAYMTANTITDVLNSKCRELIVKDGEMKLTVEKQYIPKCQDILKGFRLHVKELSKQYSEFIEIIGGKTDD